MSHPTSRITDLQNRLAAAWSVLRLEESRARLVEIEGDMNDPGFWSDQAKARAMAQEAAELKKELAEWDGVKKDLEDLAALAELGEDIADALVALDARFAKMEFLMLLSGEYDSRNAIVSFHAGAGGTDAMDWVAMLMRMLTRFAERHGWQVETLDESPGEQAGYKSATVAVRGRFAYGWLRSEAGVHRLVRISPFDAEQMRHTTFALVEVLPEFDEVDEKAVAIDSDDLRIDTFMASGKGGQSVNTTYSAVRVTHLPTGLSVSCQNERSQSQNKDTALRILKSKLYHLMVKERAEKLSDIKGAHKSAEWGNQIRSYVLHPYKMVKDHRTDV
ncbi:peptide chain release factor 2, partial [Candidatus Uhrbacteria bacterium]|nr:peptide chain release factor 2 [Candidatus Uhrbacteria bacterium]